MTERPGRGGPDVVVTLDQLNVGSIVIKDRAGDVRFVVSIANHMDCLGLDVQEYDAHEFLSPGRKKDVAVSYLDAAAREAAG